MARLPAHLETARPVRGAAGYLRLTRRTGRRDGPGFPRVGHQRCRVHFARNLLALVPKSHKDMVAAVFRTIFAQPNPATVAATWDSVRDQLAAAFPRIGPLMEGGESRGARLHHLAPQPPGEDLVDKSAGEGQQGDPSDGLDSPGGHDGGRLGSVTVAGLTQKRSFDGRGPDRDLSFI